LVAEPCAELRLLALASDEQQGLFAALDLVYEVPPAGESVPDQAHGGQGH